MFRSRQEKIDFLWITAKCGAFGQERTLRDQTHLRDRHDIQVHNDQLNNFLFLIKLKFTWLQKALNGKQRNDFKRRDNFMHCGSCLIIEESDPPGATESTWLVLEELGLDLDATDWDCQVWLGWIWMLQTGTARYSWVGFGCYRLGLPGMAGLDLDATDWDCQVWLGCFWMLQTGTARYGWVGFGCFRLGLPGMAGLDLDATDWDCQVWLGWIWMLQTGTARYGWVGLGYYRPGLPGIAGLDLADRDWDS
jgi:hypothetical protein